MNISLNAPTSQNRGLLAVKVAIIGAGNVGSSFAFALLLSGLTAEIVLVDANRAKAEGEAMDLQHAAPFAPSTRVRAGDYADCAGAVVTVVTAGAGQKPSESRLDLAKKNAAVFGQIIPAVAQANPDGLLLIATNPVDVLTHLSMGLSGLAPSRVLGSGTILDTARFRHFIGEHIGIAPSSVSAYIIGEHGDSEVPVWSGASVGGVQLDAFCKAADIPLSPDDKAAIFERTRDAAYHIIERKGATYYAIAAGLVQIVAAIVRDENTVLPVGSLIENYGGISGVAFGMPAIINRQGVARVLPLPLDNYEREALQRSAQVLRDSLVHIKN